MPLIDNERVPRQLKERTGKHYCVRCLAETAIEEYLRNDHLCDKCAQREQETERNTEQGMRDEG